MEKNWSPEENLTRILSQIRKGYERAKEEIAPAVDKMPWIQDDWYISRIYDLIALAALEDLPELALAVHRACDKIKGAVPQDGNYKTFEDLLITKVVSENAPSALNALLPRYPGYLPLQSLARGALASTAEGQEKLIVLLDAWKKSSKPNKMLEEDYVVDLLEGGVQRDSVKFLRKVLECAGPSRQVKSAALFHAVNSGAKKSIKALAGQASVCEAIAFGYKEYKDLEMEDREVLLYDSLADQMEDMDAVSTNYLFGDQLDLPKIKARAEAIQMGHAANATAQPRKSAPGRRL